MSEGKHYAMGLFLAAVYLEIITKEIEETGNADEVIAKYKTKLEELEAEKKGGEEK